MILCDKRLVEYLDVNHFNIQTTVVVDLSGQTGRYSDRKPESKSDIERLLTRFQAITDVIVPVNDSIQTCSTQSILRIPFYTP